MQDRSIYSFLMSAGALPFVASAVLIVLGIDSIAGWDVDALVTLYGVTILSFLTGIHWATQLYLADSAPSNLFIVSNVVFLAVLITFVAGSLAAAIIAQLAAFPLLLVIDYRLEIRGIVTPHYLRVRLLVTSAAWLSLACILFLA